ncbi:exopolyphosphatase [Alkalimonas sp. NCh-2]|uniref:Ppx/GppA phosphatase family protein n=1 Tax=Alkalimonas sp. NCh-2 TaxID=3144846 RepID=UPI0031F642FF
MSQTDTSVTSSGLMAAVDLGSNSFHLVIARDLHGDLQLLHREKQKVRLAEGLNNDLILSEEAMERGLSVLRQFADTLSGIPADAVRVIATYTLRRASNSQTFLRRARSLFPYPIEIISGQEEARYIYQGVAHFEHAAEHRLVMDIGGGSTEFALGQGFEVLRLSSRNMGCVSYGKEFFAGGKLSAKRFSRAILQAEQELESIASAFKKTGWQQALGTSGSVKVLRDIVQQLQSDGVLRLNELLQLKQLLIQAGHIQALELAGLSDDRRALLAPALCIAIAAFQMLDIQEMQYCEAALREGVLNEMRQRRYQQDIRQSTIASLQQRYQVDVPHSERLQRTATDLLAQAANSWQIPAEAQQLLLWACQVVEIGLQINSSGIQKHSAYILQHANLPGFNQEQQQLLAFLVRYHRSKLKGLSLPTLYLYPPHQLMRLLVLLRLCVLLNQKRRDDWLPTLTIEASEHALALDLPADWLQLQPLLQADLQQEASWLAKAGFHFQPPQQPEEPDDA